MLSRVGILGRGLWRQRNKLDVSAGICAANHLTTKMFARRRPARIRAGTRYLLIYITRPRLAMSSRRFRD